MEPETWRRRRGQTEEVGGESSGGETSVGCESEQSVSSEALCMSGMNIYPNPPQANAPQLSQPTFPSCLLFPLNIQETHPSIFTWAELAALSAGPSQNDYLGPCSFRRLPMGPEGGSRAAEPVPLRGWESPSQARRPQMEAPTCSLLTFQVSGRPARRELSSSCVQRWAVGPDPSSNPAWPLGIC